MKTLVKAFRAASLIGSLATAISISSGVSAMVDDSDPFIPELIPVELQSWWVPDFGHIHAATRLPLGQEVSGTLLFDVRIVLHNNPSHLRQLRIDTDQGVFTRISLDLDCPYDGVTPSTCAFNVPVALDTTDMVDGWRELRIRATTDTPDDNSFLNSSGIMINVQNGGVSNDYTSSDWCDYSSITGRGWYTVFEYTNVVIECVPQMPISGIHTFRVRAQKPSQHLNVALDKTHNIPPVDPWPEQPANPGQILFDEDGDFQQFIPITVDTTLLDEGWHTFAVKSTGQEGGPSVCDYCLETTVNLPAGVAKIWFYVQNGEASNFAPVVDAGDDQAIVIDQTAQLLGAAHDDGLPDTGTLTTAWSKVSGPGIATFGDVSAEQTSVDFSQSGIYVLRLTADDGEFVTSSDVTVAVSSVVHGGTWTGGAADLNSVTTTGSIGAEGGLYIAAITTKPHVDVDSVSGLGLNWTELKAQCAGRSQTGVSVWYSLDPPAQSGTVTANLVATPQNAAIAVSRYGGATSLSDLISANSNGVDGACSSGVDGDSYALTLSPAAGENAVVYSAVAKRSLSHTPGTGYVERVDFEQGSGGSTAGVVVQDKPVPPSGALVANGAFSNTVDWAAVAVKIHGGAPTNQAPVVDAGADVTILLGDGVPLAGSASDDGLPAPASLSTSWSAVSRPGVVSFADATAAVTTASFSETGVYVLRLTADDGDLMSSDEITVTVDTESVSHAETVTGGDSKSRTVSTSDLVSGEGGVYIAAVATKGPIDVIAVDGLGLSWQLAQSQCSGKGQTGVAVWYAIGTPADDDWITVTFADSPENSVLAVSRYAGAIGVGAVESANSNGDLGACSKGSNSKTYAIDIDVLDDVIVYGAVAMQRSSHTSGDGFTERAEIHHGRRGRDRAGIAVQDSSVANEGTVSVDGSFSKRADWAVITIEIL